MPPEITHPACVGTSALTWRRVLWPVLVFGGLWLLVINQVRVEWSLNPQYTYGWLVPVACAYSLWNRAGTRPVPRVPGSRWPTVWLLALAALWLPVRFIEEANPDWRLVSWLLALLAVGLSLGAAYEMGGWPWSRHFLFPFALFLVAVPWVTPVEQTVVQGLTGANAGGVVEVLGALGIPALRRGNVIEVSTGLVGIEEACSGIRSLQASLMLGLFLGEWCRLSAGRRVLLCFLGLALAFLFNLIRTFLMVWIASKQGVAAVAGWHDPSGITILLACFLSLWALAAWFQRPAARLAQAASEVPSRLGLVPPALPSAVLLWGLAGVLGLSEVATVGWYRWHERGRPAAPQWTVQWPEEKADFKPKPIPAAARQMLRYDEGTSAAWREPDGSQWIGFYLRWKPGRAAVQMAHLHAPSVCLPAAGLQLAGPMVPRVLTVRGQSFAFQRYAFRDGPRQAYAFYCLREDRSESSGLASSALTTANRLKAVLAGLRNSGQRVLEVAVSGYDDPAQAEAALERCLQQVVRDDEARP